MDSTLSQGRATEPVVRATFVILAAEEEISGVLGQIGVLWEPLNISIGDGRGGCRGNEGRATKNYEYSSHRQLPFMS